MSNDRRQHTLEVLRHATESVLSKPQQKSTSSTSDSLNDRAREAALRLLSVRSRSSKELASIIEAELENLSPCVEEDTARALVSRKVKLIDAASLIEWEFFQKQQRRLYSMLVRRGFSSELAQRIVNEALVAHREGYDSN